MNQVYLDTARLMIQVAPLVFADNVFNRFTYSRYSAVTPFIYPVASYQVIGHPRTVGVDVSVHF